MKAITISQPYASLIASGEKWVENRTWAANYHGPLAIHAGKGQQYLSREQLAEYPTGCIIAVAKLVECVQLREIGSGDLRRLPGKNAKRRVYGDIARHDHAEGPWCWVLDEIQKIQPLPFRGAQGLWEFHVTAPELVLI
jgi:hypothetical protein